MEVDKVINAKGKAVVIIGDTHIPYHHADYLDFIIAISKKYTRNGIKPIMIHAGDEVDGHAISFHDSVAELYSAGHELDVAIEKLSHWVKAFPKMHLLESNHGSLVYRRLKHHGIPIRHLTPLKELYEAPRWQWHNDILLRTKLGDVYGCHGKTGTTGKLAREQGCSAFQGHFHGKLEITWHQRVGHKRFNMFVGCGINWKSMAFHYGKNHVPKPILGCGAIDWNGFPRYHMMVTDKRGRWNGEI